MITVAFERSQRKRRIVAFGLFAALVIAGNAWLSRHSPPALIGSDATAPEWPVLVDLLLVIPLTYLALFRREGRRAWIKAGAIALFGITVAGWVVPAENQHQLAMLRVLRNVSAMLVITGEILLAGTLARLVLKLPREHVDPDRAVDQVLRDRFGDVPLVGVLGFEVRLWFWALFGSATRRFDFAGEQHFSTHAKDGHASNQQGFLMLIGAEIPILHVVLALFWSHTAAWVVTALSLWGWIFLFAEHRATLRRPISLSGDALLVRYGLRSELAIPLRQIGSISQHAKPVARRQAGVLRYCESGVPNVCIELSPPLQVSDMFGVAKPIERVYLGIDEPQRFIAAMVEHLRTESRADGIQSDSR